MKNSIVGIVLTAGQAESLTKALHLDGVPLESISVLFPDTAGSRDFAYEHHTKAPEGVVAGASTGGLLGGGLGLLAGIGALAIPGVGPLIAAGPLMAALSGAATGAALGGLTGALIGLGIPELEAKIYEGKVAGGNILVAAHVMDKDQKKQVRKLFELHGATDVTTTAEAATPKGTKQAQAHR